MSWNEWESYHKQYHGDARPWVYVWVKRWAGGRAEPFGPRFRSHVEAFDYIYQREG